MTESSHNSHSPSNISPIPSTGFGSFQSESVELLINQSDTEYEPPSEPPFNTHIEVPEWLLSAEESKHYLEPQHITADTLPSLDPRFGSHCKSLFYLTPDFTFINHGAFGLSLKSALQLAHEWDCYAEQQPLRFNDRIVLPQLVYVIRSLARFLHCSHHNLVLLENATTGLSAVWQSVARQEMKNQHKNDKSVALLRTSLAYGSVKKQMQHTQLHIIEVELKPPFTANSIVQRVENALRTASQCYNVKWACFDHITSNTAIIMPIQRLIQLCQSYNCLVVIDAAHAVMSLDELNVESFGANVYVGNLHKWFCCVKGTAFMYVQPDLHSLIQNPTISHGYDSGFHSQWVWSGLKQFGSWLSLVAVCEFWQRVGMRDVVHYNTVLCEWAARMLCHRWQTERLVDETVSQQLSISHHSIYAAMCTIRLCGAEYEQYPSEHNDLQTALYYRYKIEVPIKVFNKRLYVRISAHCYNQPKDYEKLAQAMLELRPNVT